MTDGPGPGKPSEEHALCTRVLQALHEQRVLTCNRLAAYAGASKERVLAAVDDLMRSSRVRMVRLRDRLVFLLPNPHFDACDCDGTCGEQARLLSHPPVRHLWMWMRDCAPCDSANLREYSRSQGWSRSVLYLHLDRLINVDLARRIPPPHGDLRLGWYEAMEPLPSAQAILGIQKPFEVSPTIGSIDKALSTQQDS